MRMLVGHPSTQMSDLGSSFQYEESKSMIAESMEEYVLAYVEVAYGNPSEQAPMGLMAAGGGFQCGRFLTGGIINTPHSLDRIYQTIPTGRPPQCTLVRQKRP